MSGRVETDAAGTAAEGAENTLQSPAVVVDSNTPFPDAIAEASTARELVGGLVGFEADPTRFYLVMQVTSLLLLCFSAMLSKGVHTVGRSAALRRACMRHGPRASVSTGSSTCSDECRTPKAHRLTAWRSRAQDGHREGPL